MSTARAVDVIVVGGGSCGSVVAARLSEDPSCSVMLLEAGSGFGSLGDVPQDILDARILPIGPQSAWVDTYRAELTPSLTRTVARGRVLGGSGAVNGGYFIRARPSDFDAWPTSWSFDDVLPYYCKLENDMDFSGSFHGDAGPMPVSRVTEDSMSPLTEMFVDAARRAGFADDPDKNAPDPAGGIGPVPRNIFRGVRTNAAVAYLLPASSRANLTVVDSARVLAVTFDGMRANGVTVATARSVEHLRADRVILCAGAVRTPQLLMLSGVGPARGIVEKGISVKLDHPRVGRGFSDHPEVGVYYEVSDSAIGRSPIEAVLHVDDLEIRPYSVPFDRMIPGLAIGDPMIGVGLMRPESRGDITLRTDDPADTPLVRYRYLETESDRSALSAGLDMVGEMMGGVAPLATVVGDPLLGRLGTSLHLSGSCAMGDDGSVLDDSCRVRGIDGLYVLDTSAFPVVPTRGPHATAIMLAERGADLVRGTVA
ncbi:MAG: mycofactocin system GMC family oxidoreductase MftG [Rhodococcus sp. (in: high G+C Gram-positive bacteria)]